MKLDVLTRLSRQVLVLFSAICLLVLMQQGLAWSVATLLPWLVYLGLGFLLLLVVVLLPLAALRRFRGFAGEAIFAGFYLLGWITWLGSVIVCWELWGVWAVVVGVLLLGVTVVPLALAAAIFSSQWPTALVIAACFLVAWACRVGGTALSRSAGEA